eukprot:gene12069-13191_t
MEGPSIDSSSIKSWIYPTNYPVRNYQVDISQQALFTNTLVCLPTGLGKTLIAAVVIYNYYRWFPTGKIIFMAPTRPLVNQQMAACIDIMHIPSEHVTHLEGSISADKRGALWKEHRVIFCTPQTAVNDLTSTRFNPRSIVCVVIDEAHKATGSYAYATFMEEIWRIHQQFRVLALSATPGTDIKKIENVVQNLRISHIEIRTEDDPDVTPYVHEKQIEIIKCDEAIIPFPQQIKEEINNLLSKPLRDFSSNKLIFSTQPSNFNRFVLNQVEEDIKSIIQDRSVNAQTEKQLKDSLSLAKILVECKTIFQEEEAVGLVSFFDQKIRTIRLASECIYQQLLRLHDLAKKAASRSGAKSLERRQPKIKKLKEVLVQHFQEYSSRGETTRVLIFVHLRASVLEVKKELTGMTGIRPREFIGQGSTKVSSTASSSSSSNGETIGLTQAEQAQILKQFHSGEYNVLIATSIAEEGLDIAEVDLIVLLDSVASPTRLVQRCGRTGRKRAGRIVLITAPSSSATSSTGQPPQGEDEDKLQQSYKSIRALNDLLKRASKTLRLWSRSPRMIPDNIATPNILYAAMKRDGMEVAPSSSTAPITNYFSALSKGDGEVRNEKESITNKKDIVEEEDLFAFDFGEVSTRQTKPISAFFSHHDTQSSTQLSSKSDKSKEIRKYAEIIDITMSQPAIEEVKLPPLREGKEEKFSVTSHRKSGLRSSFFELEDDDIEDWEPFSLKTVSPKKSSASKLKPNKKESPVISSAVPSSSSNAKGVIGKEFSTKFPENQISKKRCSFSSVSDIKTRKLKNMICSCTKEDDFFQAIDDLCENEPFPKNKEDNKTKKISYDWRNEETEPFIQSHNFLDEVAPEPQISSSSKTPLKRYSPLPQNSSEDWLNDSMMTADYLHSSMNAKPPKPNKGAPKVSIKKLKDVNEKKNQDDKFKAGKVGTELDYYWQEQEKEQNLVSSSELMCCICLDVGNRDKSRNAIHSSEEDEINSDSCSESDNSPIVTCAGSCKQCFHPDCYGIEEDEDKEEEFDEESKERNIITCEYCQYQQKNKFAPKRSCVLCFQSSGLLKLSTCKQWFHPICVLFTAELTLTDDGRANNLSRLNPERNPLLCMICRQRGGAVVQCKYDDCMEAFHPYCLFNKQNGQMIVWKRKNEIRYDLFCMEHLNTIPSKHLIVSSLLPIKAKKSKSSKNHITDNEINNEVDTPEQQFTPVKSKELMSLTQMELLDTDEKEKQSSLPLSRLLLPRRINKKDGEKKRLKRNNEDQHRTDKDAERQHLKLLAAARENNLYSKKFYNKHVKKCFDLEAEEGLASSEDEEREKVKKLAKRLLDDEAEVDDEEEDNSDHSSDVLSGDFINNGPYTQPSPHRNRDEYAMYLNVDRMYYEKKSPQMPHDSAEIVTSVADLVLRKNHKMYYQTNQNVYSLENTPNLLESKKRGRNGGDLVHSNTWQTEEHGRKRRKRGDRWSDSEGSDVGSEVNEEENLDRYDDSFVVDDDVIIYDTDYRESQDREEEEEEGKERQVDEEEEHSDSDRHFAPVPPEQRAPSSSVEVSSRYSNLPSSTFPPQALLVTRKALPITMKSNPNQVMERYQAETNTASTNRIVNIEPTENDSRLDPSEPQSNGHTGKRVLSCSSRVLKVNSLKPMKSIEKEDEEKNNFESEKEKESSIVVVRSDRSSGPSRLHSERSGHNTVGMKRVFREVEIEEND